MEKTNPQPENTQLANVAAQADAPLVLSADQQIFGTLEGATKQDLAFPRLHLYQGTPKERKRYGEFKPGDLLDTSSNTKIPHAEFLPIRGWRQYIQWGDKAKQEGIIKQSLNKTDWPEYMHRFADDGSPPAVTEYIQWLLLFKGQQIPFVVSFTKRALKAGQLIYTLAPMKMGSKTPSWFRLIPKEETFAPRRGSRPSQGGECFVFAITSAAALTAADAEMWKLAAGWIETLKKINIAAMAEANKEHDAGDDDAPSADAAQPSVTFGGDVGF